MIILLNIIPIKQVICDILWYFPGITDAHWRCSAVGNVISPRTEANTMVKLLHSSKLQVELPPIGFFFQLCAWLMNVQNERFLSWTESSVKCEVSWDHAAGGIFDYYTNACHQSCARIAKLCVTRAHGDVDIGIMTKCLVLPNWLEPMTGKSSKCSGLLEGQCLHLETKQL